MKNKILLSIILILLTFTAYYPSIYGEFIWDDAGHFSNNQLMIAPDGLKRIWFTTESIQYYPLTFTTFWVERRLWGLQPMGYHIVNIAFHSINAVLVWQLLSQLGVHGAWLAGAIFAIHPVQVESIAWITERKNVLSGFFYLLALSSYLKFIKWHKLRWYGLALVLFVMALLSKTSTVMLPVVLLLCIWWLNRSLKRLDLLKTLPFFVLSALMAGVTIWYEHNHTMQGVDEWGAGLPERIVVAGRNIWFYLGKMLVPYNLMFVYPRWSVDPSLISSYIPVAILFILGATIWWKRQGWGRPILMGLGYFIISLFPVMGLISMYYYRYSFVADHFQYLASIGIIGLSVGGAAWGFEQWSLLSQAGEKWLKVGFGVSVLLILGVLTWRQTYIYRDLKSLWQDTIEKNPSAWMAHNNLGHVYFEQGRIEDAIKEYRMTLNIRPSSANAHINLGLIYFSQGKIKDALKEYRIALKLNPNSSDLHNNLGLVYFNQGKIKDAIKEYRIALKIRPKNASVHNNLGVAYIKTGLVDKALEEYRMALRLNPDYLDAYNNLGNAYKAKGSLDKAIVEYFNALKLDPDDPSTHYNLGLVYIEKGLLKDAIEEHRKAIRLNPKYFEAVYNLAHLLEETGDRKGALNYYKRFIEIAPPALSSKPFIDKAKERMRQLN